jgi:hypothetical protein
VGKKLLLCFLQAIRSRKLRRDSCCHNLNGYTQTFKEGFAVNGLDLAVLDLVIAAVEHGTHLGELLEIPG